MNHLIVGEYQHKILTVGVNHAEGQLLVMLAPEIWIALHIAQKIVHPAHVPFIIKAKAVRPSQSPVICGHAVDSSAIRTRRP